MPKVDTDAVARIGHHRLVWQAFRPYQLNNSSRINQRRCRQPPIRAQDRLLVTAALIHEQLQRLLGVTVPAPYADALTQRLDAFALAVQEQALEVDLCPMAAGDDPEVGSELGIADQDCCKSGGVAPAVSPCYATLLTGCSRCDRVIFIGPTCLYS